MKYIYILVLMILTGVVNAQTVATFSKRTDKVNSGPNKELEYKVIVTIPSAANYKGYKINVELDRSKTSLPLDSIMMPVNTVIMIDKQTEDNIKIRVKRDFTDDKNIGFKLTVTDVAGADKNALLGNGELLVLIKPLNSEGLNKSDNILFYTGTNIDFIDGIKPKELYFRSSFLLNMKNNDKATKHWLYINAGKERYASGADSLARVSYSDLNTNKFHKDSTYLKSGFYKTSFEEVTDNLFTSVAYLYELNNSTNDKLFGIGEFYVGYQTIRTKYKNTVLTTQLTAIPRGNPGEILRLNPLASDYTRHQLNYNIGVGFMYKQTNDTFDVRFSAIGGFNNGFYPTSLRKSIDGSQEILSSTRSASLRLRAEGTLLSPLGLSLGFETFLRTKQVPLFNVSLTKVLSIKQLGSLFGSSAK
ncbi:hypothetical protein SAMN04488511_111107 [Pedobacter suwonensis]|uniref:Outer membrane protein beta-barrel family protein n=1 Tax=Pedobacter suwonensis TaxID=332999 RepID=A0A1I0TMD7_9SPHI|nr:hypothetical protein [Pedobacter suwonensis]SFA52703.1 hypothetical protein SAMN04488511_111107 [Pedobacter suwonensis]